MIRTSRLLLLFAFFCSLGCSLGCSQNMNAGCAEGMVACEGGCVPAGSACGVPDAALPDASLSALSVTGGSLSPAFASSTTMYTVQHSCQRRRNVSTA